MFPLIMRALLFCNIGAKVRLEIRHGAWWMRSKGEFRGIAPEGVYEKRKALDRICIYGSHATCSGSSPDRAVSGECAF